MSEQLGKEELRALKKHKKYKDLYSASYTSAIGTSLPPLEEEQVKSNETQFCHPSKVKVDDVGIYPDGSVSVGLSCPGGSSPRRTMTSEQMKCYIDGLESAKGEPFRRGEELSECEKTQIILNCMQGGGLTPTLTEVISGQDIPRGQWREGSEEDKEKKWKALPWTPKGAAKCLVELGDRGDAGTGSSFWMKYHVMPSMPRRMSDEAKWRYRLGKWFAGEPLYTATPENWEDYHLI